MPGMPANPTLDGNVFTHWEVTTSPSGVSPNVGTTFTGDVIVTGGNITVTARYGTARTITFDPNGGVIYGVTGNDTRNVANGMALNDTNMPGMPEDPTWFGRDFVRWVVTVSPAGVTPNIDTTFTGDVAVTGGNITVAAEWHAPIGQFSGTVRRADDQTTPIPNAIVYVLDANGELVEDTITDQYGRYTVAGLLPGTYTVVAAATGFNTGLSTPNPVVLTADEGAVANVYLTEGADSRLLLVDVVDSDTLVRIAGATVEFEGTPADGILTQANAASFWALGMTAPGEGEITATALHYLPGSTLIAAGDWGEFFKFVRIELERSAYPLMIANYPMEKVELLPSGQSQPTDQTPNGNEILSGKPLKETLDEGISTPSYAWTFLGWTTDGDDLREASQKGLTWTDAYAANLITRPSDYMPALSTYMFAPLTDMLETANGEVPYYKVYAVWGNALGEIGVPDTRLVVENYPGSITAPANQTPTQPLAPGEELLSILVPGTAPTHWRFLGWTIDAEGLATASAGSMTWTEAVEAGLITLPLDYMPDPLNEEDLDYTVIAVWGNSGGVIGIPNPPRRPGGGGPGGGGAVDEDEVILTVRNIPVVNPTGQTPTGPVAPGTDLTRFLTSGTAEGWRFLGWTTTRVNLELDGLTWEEAMERWQVAIAEGLVTEPTVMPDRNMTVYAVWFGGQIFSDSHEAYLVGFPDGTIRPNSTITRAEVATIFFRLLDDDYRAQIWSQNNAFSDVTAENWFNNAVSTLTNADILEGFPDGTFRGNQAITRAEFVTIVARFIAEPAHTGADMFNDIDGHWAQDAINAVGHYDWIRGFEGGDFRPNQSITRAETAAIVNRMLNRVPENTSDLLPGMVTWPDNMNTNAWFYLYIQEATNSHYHEIKADGVHETWLELKTPRDWTVLERPNSRPRDIR